jgi:hypothetical protein
MKALTLFTALLLAPLAAASAPAAEQAMSAPRGPATTANGFADPGTPPEPRLPLKFTYTLNDPGAKTDPGLWTKSDYQEDSNWKPAGSIREIEQVMHEADSPKVWFRFRMTTTRETFNNTFCTSLHDGSIHLWNEGIVNRQNVRSDGSKWMRYYSYIFRRDKIGQPCQFGVAYTRTTGRPAKLDFAFVQEKPYHVKELRDAGSKSNKFHLVLDIPHIRDACGICGPDGKYYIVGTPLLHGKQEGIDLFRADSRRGPFEQVATPWTFAASKWANTTNFGQPNPKDPNFADQIIWAPEIEYIKTLKKWVLVYFPNKAPKPLPKGFYIGIAASDTPLGPYKDVVDGHIAADPDPHLFEDDDGAVYLTSGHGRIARMKPDLSGLAEEPRVIYPRNAHAIANEGTTLFKHKGVYYFGGAFSNHYWDEKGKWSQTYDCVMSASTNGIYGPYGDRYVAIKNGGNNSFFREPDGTWHCTVWQPTKVTTIVQVELAPDGTWRPAENYDVIPASVAY